MALVEDVFKMSGTGLLVGVGVAIAAPIFLPVVGIVVRPVAREAIRGVIFLSERTRELAAEAREQWGDLVAEAQTEDGQRKSGRRQSSSSPRKRARRAAEAAA